MTAPFAFRAHQSRFAGGATDEFMAQMAKEHNNANCIAIGSRTVTEELALKMVSIWLDTEFEGGRHQIRIEKIEN